MPAKSSNTVKFGNVYSETVRAHFEHPRNTGVLAGREDSLALGAAGGLAQGAQIEFQLRIELDRITAVTFRAYGCPYTIATASWLSEYLTGRRLAELARLEARRVADVLELPPEKLGCALLAEDALRACKENWYRRSE